MRYDDIFQALEGLRFFQAFGESSWLFPSVETVHVLALTLVVGSISMIDLRLIGLRFRHVSVQQMARAILPWTWTAFAFAAASGMLMFGSKAVSYSQNTPFRVKLVLLALAGINMGLFHLFAFKTVREWGDDPVPPLRARVAGGLSLVAWIGVVACGRWTGFSL